MEEFKIASPADLEEIERIPLDQRLPALSPVELIRLGAAKSPGATAISFLLNGQMYDSPMEVSYSDLWARIVRTANMLHDLGVGPGDVVSYLLPNLPHTHYVLWGGEAAGVVNPINPLLEPRTIRDICRAAGTKVLVTLGEVPGSDLWDKAVSIRKELPDLEAVIRVMGPTEESEGIWGFDETVGMYNGDRLDSGREIDPEDRASLYHTGGTTGTPKLAPHTHKNEAAMTGMLQAASDLHAGETILCGLPLFHVNAAFVTGALPFSLGARVVLLSPLGYRDPTIIEHFFKIVERYRASAFSAVPTVLSMLLDADPGDADISSLKYAICGAAPLSVELFNRFERRTKMKIVEGYGLTEGTTASSINPLFGERKVGSIGIRLPYQQMRIVTDDPGGGLREAAEDEIGRIAIKGPNVFDGYLDPAHNTGIWIDDGWLDTGDLGRRDADGYFWLTGRKKELIIRGGHNIDPALIEEPLYRMNGVQMAAAVGRPEPHAGEVPVVYVQLQEGAALSGDQILDHLRDQIGERAAVPREVIVLEQLPLTAVGKLFKPALRWDAVRRALQAELETLTEVLSGFEIEVAEDKRRGLAAHVRASPAAGVDPAVMRDRVAERLSRYTVPWDLEVTQD